MIAGDLSARIAQEEDFIPLDSDKHIPLFSTYKFDARIVGREYHFLLNQGFHN
jgi:hypothetical protein